MADGRLKMQAESNAESRMSAGGAAGKFKKIRADSRNSRQSP
jgi:hypothetical protein